MKKFSLSSLGIFAATLAMFSTGATDSYAHDTWKICGDCHSCKETSSEGAFDQIANAFTCYPKAYTSQKQCEQAAQDISWATGHKKPCS